MNPLGYTTNTNSIPCTKGVQEKAIARERFELLSGSPIKKTTLPFNNCSAFVPACISYTHFSVNEGFSVINCGANSKKLERFSASLKKITPHSCPCTEVYSPSLRGASCLLGYIIPDKNTAEGGIGRPKGIAGNIQKCFVYLWTPSKDSFRPIKEVLPQGSESSSLQSNSFKEEN